MTTAVRIEKADCNSSVKVRVRRQSRATLDGVVTWIDSDTVADLYSTDITSKLMLCDGNRYIVEEIKA